MKGHIRTNQKCPKCAGKFADTGNDLVCPTCLTTPSRYWVDIHWHKRYKIYSDKDGRVLSSYILAHRVLTEIRQAIDRRTFDPHNYVSANIKSLQFETNIKEWLKRQKIRLEKEDIAPSYYRKIPGILNNYLIPYFQDKDVREIRTSTVEDFYMQLPQHLSLKSQKNIMDILKKYFNDLFARDEIKVKPKFPIVKIPEPHWNWASEALQDVIYNQIPTAHKPIFFFLKETGCRIGEARALWREDINFEEGCIIIRRNFSDSTYREVTKTKKQRVLPIDDELRTMLKKINVIHGFIFLNTKGRPYTEERLATIFRKAKKKAALEDDLTLYQWCRHSWASQAINNGASLNLVGAFLGHSAPQTTRKYAHTNLDGLKKVAAIRKKAKVVKIKKVSADSVLNVSSDKNDHD
ncbi:MAG: tyrosine-type recombinase/integrase [bacterium]